MRHPGRKGSETGQPVAPADLQFETLDRRNVGQHHQRAQYFLILPVKNRRTGADDHITVFDSHNDFAIVLTLSRPQCRYQRFRQVERKRAQRALKHLVRIQAGDFASLIVENGHSIVRASGDNAAGQILE